MANLPNCPKCGDEYTYEDGHMFICPMCGNEWTAADAQAAAPGQRRAPQERLPARRLKAARPGRRQQLGHAAARRVPPAGQDVYV